MIIVTVANLVVLASMAFVLWRSVYDPLRKYFWPALSVKILSRASLGLLDTYNYTIGDTFISLQDGKPLAGMARADVKAYLSFLWSSDPEAPIWKTLVFQQPRALFFGKIVSVFCLVSDGNYWLISAYF